MKIFSKFSSDSKYSVKTYGKDINSSFDLVLNSENRVDILQIFSPILKNITFNDILQNKLQEISKNGTKIEFFLSEEMDDIGILKGFLLTYSTIYTIKGER